MIGKVIVVVLFRPIAANYCEGRQMREEHLFLCGSGSPSRGEVVGDACPSSLLECTAQLFLWWRVAACSIVVMKRRYRKVFISHVCSRQVKV